MNDLIKREDAMGAVQDHFNANGFKGYDDGQKMMDRIKALPSAEATQVVRCGECKHMIADGRCMEFADDGIRPSAMDYCSYGERKESE